MMTGFGCWQRDLGGLYRDPENGKVAGVCAGLGASLQIRPKALRIGLIVASAFGFFIPILVAYGLLTLLLPPLDRSRMAGTGAGGASEGGSWGGGPWPGSAPQAGPRRPSAAELAERFALLEARLAKVEETVTAGDFELRQKFRDL